ncbi:MAG: ZIP family metal transporter [Pirellulales bacterium]
MPHVALLTYYCVFILLASIAGGMIPVWFRLTHRGMQFAVSFVAGLMLGVGMLHMLPHAIADAMLADAGNANRAVATTMWWMLVGFLAMFFIERFFCYHHHDVPGDDHDHTLDHAGCDHHHGDETAHHDVTWSGAALGLFLHSLLNGVALAASVANSHGETSLAGLGTFLVVFLHKPFDAMTIGMLMARGGYSLAWRHTVNALFSLAIPLGVLLFYFGLASADGGSSNNLISAYALAFSAGTFLCISSSDLLPELQFHQHDRGKLSAALVLGIAVAIAVAELEAAAHGPHSHAVPPAAANP